MKLLLPNLEEEDKNDKIQPKKDKVFKSKGVTHDENLPSILMIEKTGENDGTESDSNGSSSNGDKKIIM